jgi:hypothetical protein
VRVDAVTPAADSLRVANLQAEPGVRAEDSLALRNRPLFWPSRRPVAVTAVTGAEVKVAANGGTAQPSPSLKGISLSGIYGGGDVGGAILQYKGKRLRVAVGDELDGWELESIAPNSAVFVSAGVRDTHDLVERSIVAGPARQSDQPLGDVEAAARARALRAADEQQAGKNTRASLTLGGR